VTTGRPAPAPAAPERAQCESCAPQPPNVGHRAPTHRATGNQAHLRRLAVSQDDEEVHPLRRKSAAGGMDGAAAPPIVDSVLNSPGRPLDPMTQEFMASGFGTDFSDVRIHSDPQAARSAAAVDALAYTVGRDIVFGSGQYDPNAQAGRHLLAHELAHVVQHRGADMLNRTPLARKAEKGRALHWGQETTCSEWGFVESVHEYGEGEKWKSESCCNSWPFALENYARMEGWAGAASCRGHKREIATVTYGDRQVEVLCSDSIGTAKDHPANPAKDHPENPAKDHPANPAKDQLIELSPAAMLDLSGQLENLRSVSVTYSGSKIPLCPFGDDHTPRNPSAERCLTRGCQPAEGSPNDNSSWPPV
jgi:hypothetical protein